MGDLAACIELDLAAVSALVSRMEKQELLFREIDTANRRHIKVYLTGKGKRMRDQVSKSLTIADKKIFKLIRKEDFKSLRKIIQALRQIVDGKEINGKTA
jgi:DNA-binding MarR family transcriptional regulator